MPNYCSKHSQWQVHRTAHYKLKDKHPWFVFEILTIFEPYWKFLWLIYQDYATGQI